MAVAVTETAAPAIVARGLTKAYDGRVVVDHLDLEIASGEVFGLLGPNGAGKTTTILMLLGLTEPTEGTARVAGFDPTRRPLDVKSRVGFLPDNVGFYDQMTGRQNLRYTARLNRIPPKVAEARIDDLLVEVGLDDAADRPVGTYSRGMRQRLGIADTLVKDPSIVILDEPTIAIDPEGVVEIQTLIRRLADERGVTVLVSSHLLHQIQQICDRVGIFVDGRLIAEGRPEDLAARSGQVTIEVALAGADPEAVPSLVGAVEGIVSVTRDDRRPHVWRVVMDGDRTTEVAAAVLGAGWKLLELRRASDELDEIYRRYFREATS